MAGNVINVSSSEVNKAGNGSTQDVSRRSFGGNRSVHGSMIGLQVPSMGFAARRHSSLAHYEPPVNEEDDISPRGRVTLNVAGAKFDVPLAMLGRFPGTLLGDRLSLHRHYEPTRDEYYFNRDRACFEAILQYYQTGLLRRPPNVRLDMFVEEARYFQLSHEAFSQFCQDEGFVREKPKYSSVPRNRVQRFIWDLVENPQSSAGAKFVAVLSTLIIVLSIVIFCVETLPLFREPSPLPDADTEHANQSAMAENINRGYSQFTDPLFIIETICIAWFTIEFCLRFITCPDKRLFIKSPLNIIDFVAIIPYYIDLTIVLVTLWRGQDAVREGGVLTVLRVLRLFRVFRIFKLSRYSRGLQMLGQTFFMSLRELGLLLLFLGIGVILFSSAVYYAEQGYHETQFTSIPEAFWWAIVTMTTVGYGDVAPKAVFGKLVGTACAVSGLIAVALPVPIIVANFNTIYQRERDRAEMEGMFGDIFTEGENAEDATKSHVVAPIIGNGLKASRAERAPILEKDDL